VLAVRDWDGAGIRPLPKSGEGARHARCLKQSKHKSGRSCRRNPRPFIRCRTPIRLRRPLGQATFLILFRSPISAAAQAGNRHRPSHTTCGGAWQGASVVSLH